MESSRSDQAFDQALEQVLGPDPDFWGNREGEIRLAAAQERWAVGTLSAFVAVGVVVAFFNMLVGLAVGGLGAIVAVLFKIDAAFVHVTMNQRAIMELQKQVIRELRKLNSRDNHAE